MACRLSLKFKTYSVHHFVQKLWFEVDFAIFYT